MLEPKDETLVLLKEIISLSSISNFYNEFHSILEEFESFSKSYDFDSGNSSFGAKFLDYFNTCLVSCKGILGKEVSSKYLKVKLKYKLFKLKIVLKLLIKAYQVGENEFRALADDHPRKVALRNVISTENFDRQRVKNEERKFFIIYDCAMIALEFFFKYKKSNFAYMTIGYNFSYYLAWPKERKMQRRKIEMSSDLESLIATWNTGESNLLKKIYSYTHPSIFHNIFIYIPSPYPSITSPTACHTSPSQSSSSLFHRSQNKLSYLIPIRVLSPIPISTLTESNPPRPYPSFTQEVEAIIIEYHGGALMSQTTFSHQNYSIDWANSLGIPVFAVEYRLAPEFKFPVGLNDSWQAFRWIVDNLEVAFGIRTKKVILTGDSAGGNIVISICLKAIECGVKLPDAVFTSYPCVNWDFSRPSLGVLRSLDDDLLYYKIFKEFSRYYVDDLKDMESFLVSPLLYASDELLRRFPMVKLLVTLDDPLAHDTFEFVDRLLVNGVNVEVTEFPGFIHGTMSFGNSLAIPSHRNCVNSSIKILRSLISP